MYQKLALIGMIIFLLQPFGASYPLPLQKDFDWEVKIGDVKTYEITHFFDIYHDTPDERLLEIETEEGELLNVSLKKGTKLKFEITELESIRPHFKVTYNDKYTQEREILAHPWLGLLVDKTINNKTYWEEALKDSTRSYIEGDYKFRSIEKEIMQQSYKWNWKTGWYESYYQKTWNSTHTTNEFGYQSIQSGSISGFEIPLILTTIFIVTIVTVSSRKSHH